MASNKKYCLYYTAYVKRELCWFLTAALRSYEYVAFDRTLDPLHSIFEFFVPEETECFFLEIMHYFCVNDIVSGLEKHHNRLIESDQI